MKQVVVFGGAGYIGSHVVKAFINAGWGVTVFDDLSTGLEKNIEFCKDKIAFIKGDICDITAMEDLQAKIEHPNAVVCLSALKHVDESMDPAMMTHYANVNINGTVNVLNYVATSGCKRFIFSSSAATFGDHDSSPISSYDPQTPINFYGWTKLFTEEIVPWYNKVYGIESICLRYFNAAGYDKDHDIKGIETETTNLIPVIMEVLFGKRNYISIFGTDWNTFDGTCIRDYIHVTDLADAHLKAATCNSNAFKRELEDFGRVAVNLGTEKGTSVAEVINVVKHIAKAEFNLELPDSKILQDDRRIGDPESLTAYYKLAYEIFGWKPTNSTIDNIVRTTIEQYKMFYGV